MTKLKKSQKSMLEIRVRNGILHKKIKNSTMLTIEKRLAQLNDFVSYFGLVIMFLAIGKVV
jgi:hypothetical protein